MSPHSHRLFASHAMVTCGGTTTLRLKLHGGVAAMSADDCNRMMESAMSGLMVLFSTSYLFGS
ncbi:amino acid ABC transporter amino acid-binding/permease protein [Sesbania bispinosa]|nr:amino acid ABC transporter amino acid-binding/permease protein [Sesbania bispinosa]